MSYALTDVIDELIKDREKATELLGLPEVGGSELVKREGFVVLVLEVEREWKLVEMASRLALTARASKKRPVYRLVLLFHYALSTKIFAEPRLLIAPPRKICSMTGDLPSLFSYFECR
jgi:hypothetical protein